jgi:hypothetical protein
MEIKQASIRSIQFKTETGDTYRITLTNDSLNYYKNEELVTVRETGPNYDSKNLYETCVKIAAKYNVTPDKFTVLQ